MSKIIEMRWYKWDRLMINQNAHQVVQEFDEMITKGQRVVVGDIVRRDQALEMMGIGSISPLKRKRDDKDRKRKS